MKPSLTLKPNDYATQELLMKFADGVPLSCDQLNFLAWHEHTLKNPHLDPVLKYYLKQYHHKHAANHSFLMPTEHLTKEEVAKLKRRLSLVLQSTPHIELKMKPEEFLQFRAATIQELILYHGNQLLTGAPFYQGGIPQLIFFQWGNLFGVAKYVVLAEERALKSNVLIYFEEMHDRYLQDCVYQYVHRLQDELNAQMKLAPSLHPAPAAEKEITQEYHSIYSIPKLTMSPLKEVREEAE